MNNFDAVSQGHCTDVVRILNGEERRGTGDQQAVEHNEQQKNHKATEPN